MKIRTANHRRKLHLQNYSVLFSRTQICSSLKKGPSKCIILYAEHFCNRPLPSYNQYLKEYLDTLSTSSPTPTATTCILVLVRPATPAPAAWYTVLLLCVWICSGTGCSAKVILFFSKFLPFLLRQRRPAIGCTKNCLPIGVTVHSHCVESFQGL